MSKPMSQEAPGSQLPGDRPPSNRVVEFVRRHPWATAAVVGVVTITAMRPFTRHIPDPPPVYGELPAVVIATAADEALDTGSLLGRTWVFGPLCDACGVRSTMTSALDALRQRYARSELPVSVYGLEIERDADRSKPLTQALRGAFDAPEAAQLAQSWPRVVLVDGQGRLRGAYAISELGLDETYHRTLHVLHDRAPAATR